MVNVLVHDKRTTSTTFEVSDALRSWLASRSKETTTEETVEEIFRDVCIHALASLPLDEYAAALRDLATLRYSDKLFLFEKFLTITPQFDVASGEQASGLKECLIDYVVSCRTRVEIRPEIFEVATVVLQRSHDDWKRDFSEWYALMPLSPIV